jgi:indole-3-glycerol phosphate synthase
MPDFMDKLAQDAKATIATGYYESPKKATIIPASLRQAIINCKKAPIISEIKAASPSSGTIRENLEPEKLAKAMMQGGAVGVSVLTEPKHFSGSLENIAKVRKGVQIPVLMKDIVVSPTQLEAASRVGANAVLLIQAIFDRGYCNCSLGEMIAEAHSNNLEVLLETHNQNEFVRATESEADLVGINNRNLGTLTVDLNVTKKVLANCVCKGKIVVSESGIIVPADLRFLRECGAQAFLIGSSVMLAEDVEAKVREFVNE